MLGCFPDYCSWFWPIPYTLGCVTSAWAALWAEGAASAFLGQPPCLRCCSHPSLMGAPVYPELLPVPVKMTPRLAKISSRVTLCFITLKVLQIQTKINIPFPACSHHRGMFFKNLASVFLWFNFPFPELYSSRPLFHTTDSWPSLNSLSDIPFPPKPSDFVPPAWLLLL